MKSIKIITASTILATFTMGLVSCGENDKPAEKTPEKKIKDVEQSDLSNCSFTLDAESVEVKWTAYKHSTKAPVAGKFTDVKIEGVAAGKTPHDVILGITGIAQTGSVYSGDSTRDWKIANIFFTNMIEGAQLSAKVLDLAPNYDEQMNGSGSCNLEITMNDVTYSSPAQFTIDGGAVKITSEINIDNWQTDKAYDAIHEACSEKHTLPADGKPITHKTMSIELLAMLTKDCK